MNKKIYKSPGWIKTQPHVTDIYKTAQEAWSTGDMDRVDQVMKTAFQQYRLYDIINVAAHLGRRHGEDSYNLIDKDGNTYSDPDLGKGVINSNPLSMMTQVLHILENDYKDWRDHYIDTDSKDPDTGVYDADASKPTIVK